MANSNVNENILKKIESVDCDDGIKRFIKKIFIYELRRRKGEEFLNMYLMEIEKNIADSKVV